VNFHFGEPRGHQASASGQCLEIRRSARCGWWMSQGQDRQGRSSEAFGTRYMIAFDKGMLKLRHYNAIQHGGVGGPWRIRAATEGPAGRWPSTWPLWVVGGKGVWSKMRPASPI